jgi:hypothetical protein
MTRPRNPQVAEFRHPPRHVLGRRASARACAPATVDESRGEAWRTRSRDCARDVASPGASRSPPPARRAVVNLRGRVCLHIRERGGEESKSCSKAVPQLTGMPRPAHCCVCREKDKQTQTQSHTHTHTHTHQNPVADRRRVRAITRLAHYARPRLPARRSDQQQ